MRSDSRRPLAETDRLRKQLRSVRWVLVAAAKRTGPHADLSVSLIQGSADSGVAEVSRTRGPDLGGQTPAAWILSSLADNLYLMSEARDVATHTELSVGELAWLDARLEEYRELLQYLRDH